MVWVRAHGVKRTAQACSVLQFGVRAMGGRELSGSLTTLVAGVTLCLASLVDTQVAFAVFVFGQGLMLQL